MRTIAINNEVKQNLNNLLKQMESKTKFEKFNHDCSFTTTYVTGGILKNNKNAIYGSSLSRKTSTARLNGKDYTINNETGAIKAEKPSLKEKLLGVSKNTVKIISDTINMVKENFENNEVVQQYSWGVSGFTEKGYKNLLKSLKTKKES